MKLKYWLLTGMSTLGLMALAGYWYVFIANAPQLDAAPISTINTGLTFQLESFESKAMGETRQYGIILPADYAQNPHKYYPVIILLHGGHDDATAYSKKYAIAPILQALYKSHRLPPAIVIMPDGNDDRGSNPIFDPAYFDGPHGQLDQLIGSELVQVIKTRYRTADNPQLWAMGGISSGGWGAFNIGLRHLNQFHTLFSHSGYFTDSSGTANSPEDFVGTMMRSLSAHQRQQLHFYIDAGANDKDFVASSQQFHQTLDQLGIANEFHVFPGGHGLAGADFGWNYFRKHLMDSLSYVGQQFQDQAVQSKSAEFQRI